MTSHIARVSTSFNKAFAGYNQHAIVQHDAGRILIQNLIHFRHSFTHVLDAGCGTGSTTTALANAIQYESLLAIDISSSLLQQAAPLFHTNFKILNFDDIATVNTSFDLIFSNLALHWSPSFSATLDHLKRALANDGMFAFTIPLQDTFHEMKDICATNHFMTHDQAIALLRTAGYQLHLSYSQSFTTTYPDGLSALRAIKHTGANCVVDRKQKSLTPKSLLSKLDFNQLSYHIGFFIAGHAHG